MAKQCELYFENANFLCKNVNALLLLLFGDERVVTIAMWSVLLLYCVNKMAI